MLVSSDHIFGLDFLYHGKAFYTIERRGALKQDKLFGKDGGFYDNRGL